MVSIKPRFTRLALSLALTTVIALGTALPTFAAGDDTDVNVLAGSLAVTTPAAANFTSVTLDGTLKTTTAALATFTVTDARGNGAGWHVTAQATQFAEWDSTLNSGAGGYKPSGRTIPANSLTMTVPSVAANGTTSPAPTIASGPYTLDSGSAVSIASAAADEGMGIYDLGTTTLTLSLPPATTYAAPYRSTVTISVITAP